MTNLHLPELEGRLIKCKPILVKPRMCMNEYRTASEPKTKS